MLESRVESRFQKDLGGEPEVRHLPAYGVLSSKCLYLG